MTTVAFDVRYLSLPLREPYWLAFGPVSTFETFILRAETSNGIGFGEVTPLPGYSFETAASVRTFFTKLADGGPLSAQAVLADFRAQAPMAVSGLACALDTIDATATAVFRSHHGRKIPCIALCGGTEPEEAADRARFLTEQGYDVLKVKIGGDVSRDLARVEAICAALPVGATIRVDANQQMSEPDALRFARAAQDLPIELMEQPYKPEADAHMRVIRDATTVPLMLDESIWTESDIDRAAALGMNYVKLKLCKHLGLAENLKLIAHARNRGLNIVYGNGVQSHIGNRQEAFLHLEAGLTTAIESNGFAKIAEPPPGAGMHIAHGALNVDHDTDPALVFEHAAPVANLILKH